MRFVIRTYIPLAPTPHTYFFFALAAACSAYFFAFSACTSQTLHKPFSLNLPWVAALNAAFPQGVEHPLQKAQMRAVTRANTVKDRAVTSIVTVEAVLRAAADVPVTGAVTPVVSFSPSFVRAELILALRASPEPSVDFMVVTAAASLARILVWTTTLELRRRAASTDTMTTFSGTVPAELAMAFLNDKTTASSLN
jgi:hypothetical protein